MPEGDGDGAIFRTALVVAFASNDERTAKRISDSLGTATEMRAQANYAGHRLRPWLGHVMVSRQETARPLLRPGEVMQLPPADQIVMVSGLPPIRAKKLRYYEDGALQRPVLPPPPLGPSSGGTYGDRPTPGRSDDWTGCACPLRNVLSSTAALTQPVAGSSKAGEEDAEGASGASPSYTSTRLSRARAADRERAGREASPTAAILDSHRCAGRAGRWVGRHGAGPRRPRRGWCCRGVVEEHAARSGTTVAV